MRELEFRQHLIVENKSSYLSSLVSSALEDAQEIESSGNQIGVRQLVDEATTLVGKLRKILHSSFPRSQRKYLRAVQKCGVAIMKAIDEKGDLKQTITDVRAELQKVVDKLSE
jgi:hypothetical protein